MLSAICFSLDQSKILLSKNGPRFMMGLVWLDRTHGKKKRKCCNVFSCDIFSKGLLFIVVINLDCGKIFYYLLSVEYSSVNFLELYEWSWRLLETKPVTTCRLQNPGTVLHVHHLFTGSLLLKISLYLSGCLPGPWRCIYFMGRYWNQIYFKNNSHSYSHCHIY